MLGGRLAGNRNHYMTNKLIRPQCPDLDQDSTFNIRLNGPLAVVMGAKMTDFGLRGRPDILLVLLCAG